MCYVLRTHNATAPLLLFQLNCSQTRRVDKLKRLLRLPLSKELEKACLQFQLLLLNYKLTNNKYASSLLSSVAVLSLKAPYLSNSQVLAHKFLPMLLAIITMSKALILRYAYYKHVREREALPNNARLTYKIMHIQAAQFITLTNYIGSLATLINCLLQVCALIRAIIGQYNASSLILQDSNYLLINRQSFTIVDLQAMLKGLCKLTRLLLLSNLLLLNINARGCVKASSTQLPLIALSNLIDSLGKLALRFSFLDLPANSLNLHQDQLLKQAVCNPSLVKQF